MLGSWDLRNAVIAIWIALWLYLSLGLVLISFSAIQFQSNIIARAKDNQPIAGELGGATVVSVAHIQLRERIYSQKISEIPNLAEKLGKLKSTQEPPAANSISAATKELYTKLFKADEAFPLDPIAELRKRCEQTADTATKTLCGTFESTVKASGGGRTPRDPEVTDIATRLEQDRKWEPDYENSNRYSEAIELDGYRRATSFLFPWLSGSRYFHHSRIPFWFLSSPYRWAHWAARFSCCRLSMWILKAMSSTETLSRGIFSGRCRAWRPHSPFFCLSAQVNCPSGGLPLWTQRAQI